MAEFAYRDSLERARKATLDQRSKFAAPEAAEQKQEQAEGLMRPRARPEVTPEQSGMAGGIGLALMEAAAYKEAEAPTESTTAPETSPMPEYRPGSISESDLSDREILALTLQAEAGGEGYEGMLAVGSVIKNRVDVGGYGKGIRGVIMKPAQFSAWNSVTGYAGGEGGLNMDKMRPSKTALEAADRILSGSYEDPTGGATHYYNPSVATPKWGPKNTKDWRTIGGHIFGRA
jgi:spore germination cell wall hydrolase CwlJ-like protein